jgi:hypothetical protein
MFDWKEARSSVSHASGRVSPYARLMSVIITLLSSHLLPTAFDILRQGRFDKAARLVGYD